MAAPVGRSVGSVPPGSGLPAYLLRAGFGSNVSTCEGPPFMNRWMTRLALAGKGEGFTASGLMEEIEEIGDWPRALPVMAEPRSEPRAIVPMPIPQRASISRRVRNAAS